MTYARRTKVSVESSRAEIERLLRKYGADKFAYMSEETSATIGFRINNRMIKFVLRLPNYDDYKRTPARRQRRSAEAQQDAWETACREHWRSLVLCIKAKLENSAKGIVEFEDEFLAHFVTQDGRTIGEIIKPQLDKQLTGVALQRLLPSGTPGEA